MAKRKPGSTSGFANPELPAPDPAISVFINCPFDPDYERLLDAIVFTAVCCGFHPRTASESEGVDVPRMDRIVHAIFTSNYSIHDLSRYRGEGEELLARMNMPLELGIVVGRRFVSGVLADHDWQKMAGQQSKLAKLLTRFVELSRSHRWLVLVPEDTRYEKFISDLAGFDLKRYNGQVTTIVPRVMSWLITKEESKPGLEPPAIIEGLQEFYKQKEQLKTDWAGEVPWEKIIDAARETAMNL